LRKTAKLAEAARPVCVPAWQTDEHTHRQAVTAAGAGGFSYLIFNHDWEVMVRTAEGSTQKHQNRPPKDFFF